MNITGTTPTVFDPATKSIIDFVKPTETNEQALLRLERWGPGLIVLAYDDAIAIHENAAKTEPAEITPERWEDMLCVLPPASWRNTGAEESFKLSERKTGLITSIFVRLEDRYFTFDDDIRTPHATCCDRVRQSHAFMNPSDLAPSVDKSDTLVPHPEPEEDAGGRGWPSDDNDRS